VRPLILLGCGNFAQTAHYYFARDSDYQVVAFTVDAEFLEQDSFLGLPVVPFEEVEKRFAPSTHHLFVAMGLREVNRRRAAKLAEAEAKGYTMASYVSSRAIVPAELKAGPNTWIMENAHVHPFATIGRNAIIWGSSAVGVKSQIGDHCWISGAIVGDSVTVGEGTFLGLGSVIASFVTVGKHNLIGAGALVLKNTQDEQIYPGLASEASAVPSSRFGRFNG
jgi:sugar O-acyltransferase (sialic acid O-acetyltransferase NeuD family)